MFCRIYVCVCLSFSQGIADNTNKAMNGIVLLCKLQSILPRSSFLTIYKSFVRPQLDYGDVIYDQPFDQSCLSRIESTQDNAA